MDFDYPALDLMEIYRLTGKGTMPQPEGHEKKEYLAQTKMDEAIYALLELGWTEEDLHTKVEELYEQFAERDEDE